MLNNVDFVACVCYSFELVVKIFLFINLKIMELKISCYNVGNFSNIGVLLVFMGAVLIQ